MAKSYWTKIQTPNGLKYFRADDVTDELMQKIKDEANDVFYVEYGTTTFADAEAAYLAGKTLVCREIGQTIKQTRMDDLYFLIDYMPTAGTYTGHFVFSNITGYIQTNVRLTPSATYTKTMTTMATRQEAVDTLAAEIAPDYLAVVNEYVTEDKFPIPAGTIVTELDNTSSSVLQYLYKSKVAIDRSDAYTSDPLTAPEKWDKIRVADELDKDVAYVDILQTPFADVLALYNQGKYIVGRNGYEFYRMTGYNEAYDAITSFSFQKISGPVVMTWYVTSDGPSETNNWVTPPSIYYNASIYNIAPPYDETSTYSAGDVVSRDYTLYRCNTDISVAEQWTPAHWTQTTVADELKSRPVRTFSFSDDSYPSGADIWNAVSTGHVPMLKRTQMYVTRMYIMTQYGSHGNERDVYFYSFQNRDILRLHTSNRTTWTWTSSDMYDSSLSSVGTNAVQNQTLYGLINDLQSRVAALEGSAADKAVTPAGLLERTATTERTGLVQLATNEEADSGVNPSKALTPATLAATFKNIQSDFGFQKMPNGTVIQWGKATVTGVAESGEIIFPIAFPNKCANVTITPIDSTASVKVQSSTTGHFKAVHDMNGAVQIYWLAIGY